MKRAVCAWILLTCWCATALTADSARRIVVSVGKQTLTLYDSGAAVRTYRVSTASKGAGNRLHSGRTPLGRHEIAKKIGSGLPVGAVLKNRVYTGSVARINRTRVPSEEDQVTTRILWLRGLEPGVNLGGRVDTFRRLIYIHGTADEGLIGTPASHGCIRMKNRDVIELYDWAGVGTPVLIVE